MADYYSFKEFAELTGVSVQALYKAKKIKNYIEIIDGNKKINAAALKLYNKEPFNNRSTTVVKPFATVDKPLNEDFKDIIKRLETELDNKQKAIEKDQETIARLTELLDQEQKLHAAAVIENKALKDSLEEQKLQIEEKEEAAQELEELNGTINNLRQELDEKEKIINDIPSGIINKIKWIFKK